MDAPEGTSNKRSYFSLCSIDQTEPCSQRGLREIGPARTLQEPHGELVHFPESYVLGQDIYIVGNAFLIKVN